MKNLDRARIPLAGDDGVGLQPVHITEIRRIIVDPRHGDEAGHSNGECIPTLAGSRLDDGGVARTAKLRGGAVTKSED
jgi:hypothetical protein